MDITFNKNLKDLPVFIQCTFANAYAPVNDTLSTNPGTCIRSFDRRMPGIDKTNKIGTLTGNIYKDSNGVVWLESNLLFTNRMPVGWFRERDIYHMRKGTQINPEDTEPGKDNNKKSILAWITAGITALSLLR